MSLPTDAPNAEAATICPYLGLVDDADSHATYSTDAHRCYRLPNPTRVATPHQESFCLTVEHPTCPIYQGEGVAATTQPAAVAGAAESSASEGGGEDETSSTSGPDWGKTEPTPPASSSPLTTPGGRGGSGSSRPPRAPRRRREGDGAMSMPAATIALFALAIVVVIVAFFINRQLGDDNGRISPADSLATQSALRTETADPSTATPAQSTEPPAESTATAVPTQPSAEPTATTPSGGGNLHLVVSGDTCGAIAEANGVTLQAFLDANNLTEDDCLSIQPGQELIIP